MICYVDSSVILRRLLGQSPELKEWAKIRQFVSSRLLRLECFRTLHRWYSRSQVSDEEMALRLDGLQSMMTHIGILPIAERVLQKAEENFLLPVGSLDGIHLATALLWRERHGDDIVFATHDRELGLAAKAYGFQIIGI